MIERKKKLFIIQTILFLTGISIIFYTYFEKEKKIDQLISFENKRKVANQIKNNQNPEEDVFFNIKYSGIDLAGNRYILVAKEAINNDINEELVEMKFVEVTFYFKDETTLNVKSDSGVYNNRTLDMLFEDNIKAIYEGSQLTADKADYSNSKSFLTISDNVVVNDQKGILIADKLLFDIKKQNLSIVSFNDNKINANINVK